MAGAGGVGKCPKEPQSKERRTLSMRCTTYASKQHTPPTHSAHTHTGLRQQDDEYRDKERVDRMPLCSYHETQHTASPSSSTSS